MSQLRTLQTPFGFLMSAKAKYLQRNTSKVSEFARLRPQLDLRAKLGQDLMLHCETHLSMPIFLGQFC
ncbi:hypothetical protein MES5069_440050 [Mesorhizobium escarrei]|uniref:Uncharacterized protein n=1 Tax=Mesorhizobium escarrei TaxID=666018 RepID=A0ABN8K325_9HYPH|nr:hypothetical protein MES5069_440050 [Mesorhizobium escarrei]